MMKAYANGNSSGTYGSSTRRGQQTIRDNMTRAGASQRQINNALRRAQRNPSGRVTRVNG